MTGAQRDLFGDAGAAFAARVDMPRGGSKRLIMRYLQACGDRGATCEEIERETKLLHQSASSALRTLYRTGVVEDSGLRRANKSGYRARIWRAVQLPTPPLKAPGPSG